MTDDDRRYDDELLANVLRRYLTDGQYRYYLVDKTHLSLDGEVFITPEEWEVFDRLLR